MEDQLQIILRLVTGVSENGYGETAQSALKPADVDGYSWQDGNAIHMDAEVIEFRYKTSNNEGNIHEDIPWV